MRLISLLFPVLSFLPYASAQAETWWQCGGFSWTGPTTCLPGVVCVIINSYFKQCVPECQATQSNTAISTVEPAPVATPTTSRVAIIAPGTLQHRATDSQHTIAALDGWAAGSFLQRASGSRAPTLGSSSWREWFLTNGSIRLVNLNWSPQCVSYLYLNTKAAETSYKPLAFEAVGTTLDWSFNGPNGTLSTSEGFNTFVTCSDGALYLQTGSDVPSGNCTTTRLGLGPW